MAEITLEFKESFRKDFRSIPKQYHKIIYKKIEALKENPKMGSKLKGNLGIFRRFKVGSYRVAYQYKETKLIVLMIKVGARKDFYEKLKRLHP
ncbi:type II toxin-antitoxin system RelE/ParE family toxin [bacterium]|nr:type II toxin-antitoxin system RelE/ParE family toxin [bacterium]